MSVLVKVLHRERDIETETQRLIHRERERDRDRKSDKERELWRLIIPKIYKVSWQASDPREPTV